MVEITKEKMTQEQHDKWKNTAFLGWIFHRMNVQDKLSSCVYCEK